MYQKNFFLSFVCFTPFGRENERNRCLCWPTLSTSCWLIPAWQITLTLLHILSLSLSLKSHAEFFFLFLYSLEEKEQVGGVSKKQQSQVEFMLDSFLYYCLDDIHFKDKFKRSLSVSTATKLNQFEEAKEANKGDYKIWDDDVKFVLGNCLKGLNQLPQEEDVNISRDSRQCGAVRCAGVAI